MIIDELAAFLRQHDTALILLGIVSALTFVLTLVAVPWLVTRLPADYFAHRARQPMAWQRQHPLVRLVLLVARNLAGIVFLVLGIIMLVLPGQGLITMVAGLMLMDFPGKYHLMRWLVEWPAVHRSMNWLRRRRGRPPLEL